MQLLTPTHIEPLHPLINHSDKLLVMGSCFAEHIGGRLARMKFPTVVNPYGPLYNPLSIVEGLERLVTRRPFTEDELHDFPDGGWSTWLHHSRFSHPDRHQALTAINDSFEAASRQLAEADMLVITLGTAWVYRLSDTGKVVGNCHKVPERQFVRQRLQVHEIVDALAATLRHLGRLNPRLRVLLTVSPVRHLKEGLHGNQLSKATLLLAVDALCSLLPGQCHYFPAYEILVDELRDYRFYADDMAHPSAVAVDYVWQQFVTHCIASDAQDFMHQWERVCRALDHRPFHPESEQYKQFVNQQLATITLLKEHRPYLDVQEELSRCKELLAQA